MLLSACDAERALFIDVRTDLVPGTEFDTVRVSGVGVVETPAVASDPYFDGVRVAELEGLESGTLDLEVSLRRGDVDVLSRDLRVQVDGREAVTVVFTRSCRGVSCPGDGDDSSADACFGGRCVAAGCTLENPTQCGAPSCTADADCSAADECSVARCVGGACALEIEPGACGPGRGCVPARGCPSRAWIAVDSELPIGPLTEVTAAYHEVRGTVMLYGGRNEEMPPSSVLWEWDGATLTAICDPCDPGPRSDGGMTYDAARDRLVLFGGWDGTRLVDDLWEWDGATWERIDLPGGPSPRTRFAFLYDPSREVTVVFGGGDRHRGDIAPVDDVVYEYDGVTWQTPTPTGERPSARSRLASAYLPSVGVVFYGGSDAANDFRDDLWQWDGATFTRSCDPCTGIPRRAARLGYLESEGALVLMGGYDGVEIAGTWDYDSTSGRFSLLDPFFVPARDSQAIAYDRARDVLVTYGGNGDSCPRDCDDLYEYRMAE